MAGNIEKMKRSGLGYDLIKKLEKTYPPSKRIDEVFRGNDITFITTKTVNP